MAAWRGSSFTSVSVASLNCQGGILEGPRSKVPEIRHGPRQAGAVFLVPVLDPWFFYEQSQCQVSRWTVLYYCRQVLQAVYMA